MTLLPAVLNPVAETNVRIFQGQNVLLHLVQVTSRRKDDEFKSSSKIFIRKSISRKPTFLIGWFLESLQ